MRKQSAKKREEAKRRMPQHTTPMEDSMDEKKIRTELDDLLDGLGEEPNVHSVREISDDPATDEEDSWPTEHEDAPTTPVDVIDVPENDDWDQSSDEPPGMTAEEAAAVERLEADLEEAASRRPHAADPLRESDGDDGPPVEEPQLTPPPLPNPPPAPVQASTIAANVESVLVAVKALPSMMEQLNGQLANAMSVQSEHDLNELKAGQQALLDAVHAVKAQLGKTPVQSSGFMLALPQVLDLLKKVLDTVESLKVLTTQPQPAATCKSADLSAQVTALFGALNEKLDALKSAPVADEQLKPLLSGISAQLTALRDQLSATPAGNSTAFAALNEKLAELQAAVEAEKRTESFGNQPTGSAESGGFWNTPNTVGVIIAAACIASALILIFG